MPGGRGYTYVCTGCSTRRMDVWGSPLTGPPLPAGGVVRIVVVPPPPLKQPAASLSLPLSLTTLSQQQPGYPAGSHGNTGVGAAPGRQSELVARMRETSDPSNRGFSPRLWETTNPLERRTVGTPFHYSLFSPSVSLAAFSRRRGGWDSRLGGNLNRACPASLMPPTPVLRGG